ncbi:unnamed protein product [Camellia sinensis]
MSSLSLVASERGFETPDTPCGLLTKYVGGERQEEGFEISNSGLNQMDKTLCVGGAHIAHRIWEVAVSLDDGNSSKSICKGPECNTFLFKCNLQHKCEQDLRVHHGKAVQPTMGS